MSITSQTSRTFFIGHNLSATHFVYNSANSVAATSGWTDCRSDHVVIQTCVATHTRSQSVIFRVEGKASGIDRIASVLILTEDGVNPIDKLSNITARFKEIRVGAKTLIAPASLSASPVNVYAGVILTDIK